MTYSRSPREGHTAAGWWFMTHARGGAAIAACFAIGVLGADLAVLAYQRQSGGNRFWYGVLGGLLLCAIVWVGAGALGMAEPIGADRVAARARWRRQQRFSAPLALVGYPIAFLFGVKAIAGVLLAQIAVIALMLMVAAVRDVRNPSRAWHPKP